MNNTTLFNKKNVANFYMKVLKKNRPEKDANETLKM